MTTIGASGRFIKPIGYASGRDGQRRRLYDKPMTPLDRLLAAGVVSPAQESELIAYRDSLNPAAIARQIADLQATLLKLAKDKTEKLYLAAIPSAVPDVSRHPRPGKDCQLTLISRAFLT